MYSFGILLFELLCGRKSIVNTDSDKYLAPLALTHYREKKLQSIIDWDLWKQMDSQSFAIFTQTAYECLAKERSERPDIDEIVTRLEKALELQQEHQKAIMSKEFAYLKVPFESIRTATNNFAEENIVCTTKFERRYRGNLLWASELIGIEARRWRLQEEQRFWMDISMLSSLKHKNLVSLVGFCDENDEKIIIMKRGIRGGLGNYLRDPVLLTWVRRLEICVSIAHALSYIHFDESRDFSVIHRKLCSANVVLNDDWEPKLYFFDFSMKIEASQRHHSFHTNEVEHANGYGDPTYIETKSVNHKSDMYSFGILLFELLCGRKSIVNTDSDKYLAPLALTHYREKKLQSIIDWDLWKQMDSQSFNIFTETAYECLAKERSERPDIDEIVTRLEKALELQKEHQKAIMWKYAHLKVPLENIRSATNNFAEAIVTTVFEKRYWGKLLWFGELIGIEARRWRLQEEQRFWMNISMLSSLKHKNLVSLIGFCDENDEKIIIMKRAIRGGLGNYLSDSVLLTWVRRLEICVSIAHALSYIHYHESCDFSVIHRHVCSANVVLNDDWEPKLYYFDFSMKIEASQRHHSFRTNKVEYANGYGDPTYVETKSVNHKSDMYSFGILLFELLCGRKSIVNTDCDKYLAPLALSHYREKKLENIIHQDLWKQMDSQSFNMFAEIAYECLAEERLRCPNIDDIVPRLEKALELHLKRESYDNSIGSPSFMHKKFQHLKIELQAIKSATKDFAVSHCIGKGGFGKVYKGELALSKGQSVVALKRLDRAFGQGDPEFWKEIIMLSQYRHDNIVSLLGFCDDCGEKILVYNYASKRSLDLYLNHKDLTWVQRLEICIGAARGLAYLHNPGQTQQRVLHRDIKSSNILLDENWNARIADLGLSKFGPANQQYTFLVSNGVGTPGYWDPLYIETGLLTKESDVYSFGVVLFEILCGRLCIRYKYDKHLTTLVRECDKQNTISDVVYGSIKDEMNPHSLKAFTTIAYQCINRDQEKRPLMAEVVKVLENALMYQVSNEPPTSSLSREPRIS